MIVFYKKMKCFNSQCVLSSKSQCVRYEFYYYLPSPAFIINSKIVFGVLTDIGKGHRIITNFSTEFYLRLYCAISVCMGFFILPHTRICEESTLHI